MRTQTRETSTRSNSTRFIELKIHSRRPVTGPLFFIERALVSSRDLTLLSLAFRLLYLRCYTQITTGIVSKQIWQRFKKGVSRWTARSFSLYLKPVTDNRSYPLLNRFPVAQSPAQITLKVFRVMLSIMMKNTVNSAPISSFILAAALVEVMYS